MKIYGFIYDNYELVLEYDDILDDNIIFTTLKIEVFEKNKLVLVDHNILVYQDHISNQKDLNLVKIYDSDLYDKCLVFSTHIFRLLNSISAYCAPNIIGCLLGYIRDLKLKYLLENN